MNRIYSKFPYLSSIINYSISGSGEKVLLMFHGYGHSHKNMKGIEEALEEEYTIYNFDLFFHGFSEWNYDNSPLTKDHWKSLLNAFLEHHKIKSFSLLGFSLGGKVALATVELMPQKIEKLHLIAPDGLTNNFWYNIITSKALQRVFKLTIEKPEIFTTTVKLLEFLKLVDKSTLRFSSTQMNSREKRRRVYYSWTVYKGLRPDIAKVVQTINHFNLRVDLYLGEYDRIIKFEDGISFAKKIKNCRIHKVNSGHNNLLDEVATVLNKEVTKP